MQRDLDRLLKRKRRMNRVAGLLLLTFVAALSIVIMRSCSEHFEAPYNKEYRPMDIKRQNTEQLP